MILLELTQVRKLGLKVKPFAQIIKQILSLLFYSVSLICKSENLMALFYVPATCSTVSAKTDDF